MVVKIAFWHSEGEVGVSGLFHVVSGTEFVDGTDAFKGFWLVVDAEEALESWKKSFAGEEVVVRKEGFERGGWKKGGEEEIGICTFSTIATPSKLGVISELTVVGDIARTERVTVAPPTFFDELIGDH